MTEIFHRLKRFIIVHLLVNVKSIEMHLLITTAHTLINQFKQNISLCMKLTLHNGISVTRDGVFIPGPSRLSIVSGGNGIALR